MIKTRVLVLLVCVILAWALGVLAGFFSQVDVSSLFPTSLCLIVVIVFSFSFLFFGYSSPLILFFTGAFTGFMLRNALTASLIILSITVFIATYSSIRLGDALLDDMIGVGNFRKATKISFLILLIALIIALATDLAQI